jgi:hypothetical protein
VKHCVLNHLRQSPLESFFEVPFLNRSNIDDFRKRLVYAFLARFSLTRFSEQHNSLFCFLGFIHGCIGIFEENVGCFSIFRIDGNTDNYTNYQNLHKKKSALHLRRISGKCHSPHAQSA